MAAWAVYELKGKFASAKLICTYKMTDCVEVHGSGVPGLSFLSTVCRSFFFMNNFKLLDLLESWSHVQNREFYRQWRNPRFLKVSFINKHLLIKRVSKFMSKLYFRFWHALRRIMRRVKCGESQVWSAWIEKFAQTHSFWWTLWNHSQVSWNPAKEGTSCLFLRALVNMTRGQKMLSDTDALTVVT